MPKRRGQFAGIPRIRFTESTPPPARPVLPMPAPTRPRLEALAPLQSEAAPSSSTWSGPTLSVALAPGLALRRDAPPLQATRRGSRTDALAAASSADSQAAALGALELATAARSAVGPNESMLGTWISFHSAWFGSDSSAFPLTPASITAVASMFKAGRYRAFANYQSRAKDFHLASGHPWDEFLDRAFRRTRRAVCRGIGPARQSEAFDINEAWNTVNSDKPCISGGPIGPRQLLVCGSFWMLREAEISMALARNLVFNFAEQYVDWSLPASKTDPAGLGKTRRWECICSGTGSPCPFHAAASQRALLVSLFGTSGSSSSRSTSTSTDGSLPRDLPFFPTPSGAAVSKAKMVQTIEYLAASTGQDLFSPEGHRRFGGHSLRVLGAQHLARMGVDVLLIQLMARWSSDVVLRYIAEAPLATMGSVVRSRCSSSALTSSVDDLRRQVAELSEVRDGEVRPSSSFVAYLEEELCLAQCRVQSSCDGFIKNDTSGKS